jgi:hypothetical protein
MARKAAWPANTDRSSGRLGPQQMDLFRGGLADASAGAPAWLDLPKDAQDALVGLMTQLILEHARTSAMPSEAVEAGDDR